MSTDIQTYRGRLFSFKSNPTLQEGPEDAISYFSDGLLVIENGVIVDFGDYSVLSGKHKSYTKSNILCEEYRDNLILPGFIDCHVHYPQLEIIGSWGEQLMEWLSRYVFPTEKKYGNFEYALQMARFFVKQLLVNGTTTAMVFPTVHPESVDAIFQAAGEKNMCLISGKILMDRNAPDYLTDTVISAYEDSKRLIEKWHRKERLHYAVTPRFAPTSSSEQLAAAGRLLAEFPDLYLQTHLSENQTEIEFVHELFPDSRSYLDVYHSHGLTGHRSVFAHCIHLDETDWQLMHDTGSSAAFCPTSNLFLGSGLFPLRQAQAKHRPVSTALGTDVGAGTSLNILRTANEAYKVVALEQSHSPKTVAADHRKNGQTAGPLTAFEAFYLATLGGAEALQLKDRIGSLEPGSDADFIVLDSTATDILSLKTRELEKQRKFAGPSASAQIKTLHQELFNLVMLGDRSVVKETFISGSSPHNHNRL